MNWHRLATAFAVLAVTLPPRTPTSTSQTHGYGPGARVLLDAHNAYPERGQWADRIDRALSTGMPIAIEQDLYWSKPQGSSRFLSVVAHDDDALDGAPTLQSHFFERIRPLMERALRENHRETWPLIVLNLDFKDNTAEHLDYVHSLLTEYEAWLTTAPRSATPDHAEPLTTGPLLVLAGSDSAQRRRFHDEVPVGARLLAFGAIPPAPVSGDTKGQRLRRAFRMTAAQHIVAHAGNYARWVNFPWSVVERNGQNGAREWTASDSVRLSTFVRRAHEQQLWIRFYTLDGFTPDEDRGFTASYNFGSARSASIRWRATLAAGVDFVATDQYEGFAAVRDSSTSR